MIQKRKGYSLQRTMIVYFLLIAAASLMVGLEFVMETQSRQLKVELLEGIKKHEQNEISEAAAFEPIARLRAKALLMIGIVLLVTVIVLMMFIKNITEPLQHMIDVSKNISQGDLRNTIRIHSGNELAALGNVINDMSSNLQEILLLAGNLCSSCTGFMNETTRIFDNPQPTPEALALLRSHLNRVSTELSTLTGMMTYFTMYQVGRNHDGL
jgi:methyl-accepting chemotaxis protein